MREKKSTEAPLENDPTSADNPTIDALLGEMGELPAFPTGTWAAEVVDDRHPDLIGRVEVRWRDTDGRPTTRWVPTTSGMPVRRGDRVLLTQPENWPEPIVTTVIDGYARRELAHDAAGRIELRKDEGLEIHGHRGTPLLSIHEGETGPVIRILSESLAIDVPGHLRLAGRTVELQATEGSAEIEAQDDVIVRGDTIHLN